MGLLGRTVSKTAYVRMVASAHHLGVCALADGLGLIAHIERVSATLLHTHRILLLCANINVLVYSDRCMASVSDQEVAVVVVDSTQYYIQSYAS